MERMPPIPKIALLRNISSRKRFLVRASSVVARLSIPIVAAIAGGQTVQQNTREFLDYTPQSIQAGLDELQARKMKKSAPNQESTNREIEERGIKDWATDLYKRYKDNTLNPKELIKNTDMYIDLQTKIYKLEKMIDEIAFWLPTALIFLSLAYAMQKIIWNRLPDPIKKAQKILEDTKRDQVIHTLNLVIPVVNELVEESKTRALTADEIIRLRLLIRTYSHLLKLD